MLERTDEKRIRAEIEGVESVVYYDKEAQAGDKLQVLLRPEDLRIEEIKESEEKALLVTSLNVPIKV